MVPLLTLQFLYHKNAQDIIFKLIIEFVCLTVQLITEFFIRCPALIKTSVDFEEN